MRISLGGLLCSFWSKFFYGCRPKRCSVKLPGVCERSRPLLKLVREGQRRDYPFRSEFFEQKRGYQEKRSALAEVAHFVLLRVFFVRVLRENSLDLLGGWVLYANAHARRRTDWREAALIPLDMLWYIRQPCCCFNSFILDQIVSYNSPVQCYQHAFHISPVGEMAQQSHDSHVRRRSVRPIIRLGRSTTIGLFQPPTLDNGRCGSVVRA